MKKAIAIILLFTSMVAHSDAPRKTAIGMGTLTCGRYNKAPPIEKVASMSWVYGYLVAANNQRPGDFLAGTDGDAIEGAIDLYCKANPLHTVDKASAYVMFQLINQSK